MSKQNKKILIVTTNSHGDNNSAIKETGVWLEEYAVPYLVFKSCGYDVLTASPEGGLSPVDENSMSCSNPVEWDDCIKILRETSKLDEIDYKIFDALFLPGGHGPMFDLANDVSLKEIVEYFYESGVPCVYQSGYAWDRAGRRAEKCDCAGGGHRGRPWIWRQYKGGPDYPRYRGDEPDWRGYGRPSGDLQRPFWYRRSDCDLRLGTQPEPEGRIPDGTGKNHAGGHG